MAGSYYIGVATAGDNAIAGPIVAAALILDTQRPMPVFRWPESERSRPHTLSDFDAIPEGRRPQVSAWLRKVVAGSGVVVATVSDINGAGEADARAAACGRAVYRAVENALVRDPAFRLRPEATKLLVAGDSPIARAYAGPAEQRVYRSETRRPWQLQAAYAVAKTHRDQLMREASQAHPAFDFELNFGYPSDTHRLAIVTVGVTPIHRTGSLVVRELTSTE